jgi:hypothetical protein
MNVLEIRERIKYLIKIISEGVGDEMEISIMNELEEIEEELKTLSLQDK